MDSARSWQLPVHTLLSAGSARMHIPLNRMVVGVHAPTHNTPMFQRTLKRIVLAYT